MEEDASRALKLLALIKLPADLLAQGDELRAEVEGAKASAQARLPKVELALGLLHGVYGLVDLAEQYAARRKVVISTYRPTKFCVEGDGKATLTVGTYSRTFHFRAEDTRAMVDAVYYAVNYFASAAGGCVEPEDLIKVLALVGPEDW